MKRLFLSMFAPLLAVNPASADPVRVDGGLIDGTELASGVTGWFGVPFAAPPVRELRWRAPQPVKSWSGTFHADRFAPMCLQAQRSRTMNHYFGHEAISEDCLYLNIWAPRGTPRSAGSAKLPVVVWIYGGAFQCRFGQHGQLRRSQGLAARRAWCYVAICPIGSGRLAFWPTPN